MTPRQAIEILGKTYQVRWVPDVSEGLAESDYCNLTIDMEQGRPPQRTQATMLHEAIEMINEELALKIEHDTVDRIESALFAVLVAAGVDLAPLIEEPQP